MIMITCNATNDDRDGITSTPGFAVLCGTKYVSNCCLVTDDFVLSTCMIISYITPKYHKSMKFPHFSRS